MGRLARWLTNIMLVLLVMTALLFLVLPAAFASSLAVVYSGSMAPEMPVGALAMMEPVDPAEIEVGDIIAFNPPWDPDVTVSHRVIEVVDGETLSFRTKGDANEDPDFDIVPADSVIGRVTFNVPNLGYLLARVGDYSRSRLGFVLFVGLPTLLLIGSAARDMNFMVSPGKRRERQRKKMMEKRKRWRSRR
jgi:signal peptidase